MADLNHRHPQPLPSLVNRCQELAMIFALALIASIIHHPAAAQSAPDGIDPALVQSTRGIATDLLNQLGGKLKGAMSTDGPIAAVSVCKEVAPAIAKELSAMHGAMVTRVGTRVRNPKMGTPNVWQKAALTDFETRMANGEKPAEIEHWSVAEVDGGRRELRYAKAIAVQPMCVSCHGSKEDIPAPLADKIRTDYPDDQATGYSVGKLRGAVVVTRPLPSQ